MYDLDLLGLILARGFEDLVNRNRIHNGRACKRRLQDGSQWRGVLSRGVSSGSPPSSLIIFYMGAPMIWAYSYILV